MSAASEPGAILLFDGVCNLCNATVQFVLVRDSRSCVRFAATHRYRWFGKRETCAVPTAANRARFLT